MSRNNLQAATICKRNKLLERQKIKIKKIWATRNGKWSFSPWSLFTPSSSGGGGSYNFVGSPPLATLSLNSLMHFCQNIEQRIIKRIIHWKNVPSPHFSVHSLFLLDITITCLSSSYLHTYWILDLSSESPKDWSPFHAWIL